MSFLLLLYILRLVIFCFCCCNFLGCSYPEYHWCIHRLTKFCFCKFLGYSYSEYHCCPVFVPGWVHNTAFTAAVKISAIRVAATLTVPIINSILRHRYRLLHLHGYDAAWHIVGFTFFVTFFPYFSESVSSYKWLLWLLLLFIRPDLRNEIAALFKKYIIIMQYPALYIKVWFSPLQFIPV